jgi:hypothetical protein
MAVCRTWTTFWVGETWKFLNVHSVRFDSQTYANHKKKAIERTFMMDPNIHQLLSQANMSGLDVGVLPSSSTIFMKRFERDF